MDAWLIEQGQDDKVYPPFVPLEDIKDPNVPPGTIQPPCQAQIEGSCYFRISCKSINDHRSIKDKQNIEDKKSIEDQQRTRDQESTKDEESCKVEKSTEIKNEYDAAKNAVLKNSDSAEPDDAEELPAMLN